MIKNLLIYTFLTFLIGCQTMEESINKTEEDGFVEWIHQTEDADILGVSASQEVGDEEWSVFISVAEFVREEPLEGKFRELMAKSLSEVEGVSSVEEEDREVWLVEGNANGKELVMASVKALKSIYPELKQYMNEF